MDDKTDSTLNTDAQSKEAGTMPTPSQDIAQQPDLNSMEASRSKKKLCVLLGLLLVTVLAAAAIVFALTRDSGDDSNDSQDTSTVQNTNINQLGGALTLVEGLVQIGDGQDALAWVDALGGESIFEGNSVRTLTDLSLIHI